MLVQWPDGKSRADPSGTLRGAQELSYLLTIVPGADDLGNMFQFQAILGRRAVGGPSHRRTAMAWTSNLAPNRSVPAPRNARAGNSFVKYVR